MATNRAMLKEAIADAKAVKETAIANAKAALEEAFAPQVREMLSLKLQEMEDMDEMEDKNMYEMEDKESMEEGEDKDMNEVDLEELLAELENEESLEEDLFEAEEGEEDEESEESEEGEEDEEGEPVDMDMTDEELKDIIEDVLDELIKQGKVEAGPKFESDEEEEEGGEEMKMSDDEELDLAELLREIEEMEEPVEEGLGDFLKGVGDKIVNTVNKLGASGQVEDLMKDMPNKIIAFKRLGKLDKAYSPSDAEIVELAKQAKADNGLGAWSYKDGKVTYLTSDKIKGPAMNSTFGENLQSELDEAYATIKSLKNELNEINLLNAKLLYSNKIFKAKNLNESQKVKVLSSFDKATTVGEVKMVFETLNEGIKVAKTTIKENLGSASKATVTPTVKKPIVESNEAFLRMQKLAGLI